MSTISETPSQSAATSGRHLSATCVHEYTDVQQAMMMAMMHAAATGGRVCGCSVFSQGGRILASTSLPMSQIDELLLSRPASRGQSPRDSGNRPVIPEHVRSIADYLVKNPNAYVLPPLSVTYQQKLAIFTVSTGMTRQGWLVIGAGQKGHITDGQHRFYAIVGYDGSKPKILGARNREPSLANDAVAVQITIEDDMNRLHQDFADMAQTKALPKALLTVYDLRDPVNRLVYDVVSNSRLFTDRVDETSTSLSKSSNKIALSNWVRNLVVGAFAPDYFVTQVEADRLASEHLASEQQITSLKDDLLYLLEEMTSRVPGLERIAKIDPQSAEAGKIPELREDILATTAVGLGICGMVLKIIRQEAADPQQRRAFISNLFTKVDWLRSHKDAVWVNNGILSGGSIKAARGNIFVSTAGILRRLEINVPKKMQKAVDKSNGTNMYSPGDFDAPLVPPAPDMAR